jgi:hypothetical protein
MKKTLQTIKKTSFYCVFFSAGLLTAQTTYTFTNASATGKTGPTSPQIVSAYLSTNLNGSVTVTSGIQSFTVPSTGPYRIKVAGASGQNSSNGAGGFGMIVQSDFTLTAGTVLNIVVGQQGLPTVGVGTYFGGTGGGGSFVYTGAIGGGGLLSAAGGGGGALSSTTAVVANTCNANYSTNGYSITDAGGYIALGGVGGNGGGFSNRGINGAGPGTGWFSDYNPAFASTFPTMGGTRFSGGIGVSAGLDGGFGGGGASGTSSGSTNNWAGGGGGYSGGGAGHNGGLGDGQVGGGGGSFLTGTNQTNVGFNTGNGSVIITVLYGVSIAQTSTIACNGLLTAALSASVSGGVGPFTYSWSPSGGTASTATGLGAGTYTCTVISATSGSVSSSFTVTQPASVVSAVASQTNVSCYGGANGVITLTTTGGTAPYSYSWTPTGGSTATASGLVAGTYSCTVKDANLCSAPQPTATISQPATFSVVSSNSVICAGESANLTATGATSYTWNTAATTSVIAVSPSVTTTYTVTGVTGACSNSLTITQNVNTCVGVQNLTNNDLNIIIYPNPNNGVFTIELNTTTQVIITNVLGDVLSNSTLTAGKQTLDIQNKANGIYFVKLVQNGKQQTIKLIKE